VVFKRERLAVFCDGDFWHGRNWPQLKGKLSRGTNSRYWIDKIAFNKRRDVYVSRALKRQGWKVIRIWERDIIRDVGQEVKKIRALLRAGRHP
jgi:DNA mismatch endonuclease (patch repair protein)